MDTKQLLIEVNPLKLTPQTISESLKNNGGKLIVETLLATAEVKNGNGRYYSRKLWERELNKYLNDAIKIRNSVGELDHPDSQVINLKNVSHLVTEVWLAHKYLHQLIKFAFLLNLIDTQVPSLTWFYQFHRKTHPQKLAHR